MGECSRESGIDGHHTPSAGCIRRVRTSWEGQGMSRNYNVLSLSAPAWADVERLHPTGDPGVGMYGDYPYYGMYLTKIIHVGNADFLGGSQTILPPDADRSSVSGINQNDWLVGTARYKDDKPRAFAYHNGQYLDLHNLTGMGWSVASDINVAGIALVAGSKGETWDTDGVLTFLIDVNSLGVTTVGPLAGDTSVQLSAINANGDAVGTSWGSYPAPWHPVIYEGGALSALFAGEGRAIDINDKGQVLSMAGMPELPGIFEGGQLTPLPASFEPTAINNSGAVVGSIQSGVGIGVIYDGGVLEVLTNLCVDLATGWTITDAKDIDDQGRIAIFAWNPQIQIVASGVLRPVRVDQSRLKDLRAEKFLRLFGGVARDGGGRVVGPRGGGGPIGPLGP
jgi:probable HAF family extracellular repeat protein